MAVKFQITLPDDLASELKAAANRQKLPLAQLIRETMKDKLRDMRSSELTSHPFARIQGIADSGETDLSSRVDETLYR